MSLRLFILAVLFAFALAAPGTADAQTGVAVSDAEVSEGDSGTTNMIFTVELEGGLPDVGVPFTFTTENVSATAPADYVATPSQAPAELKPDEPQTVTVQVNGDALDELRADER